MRGFYEFLCVHFYSALPLRDVFSEIFLIRLVIIRPTEVLSPQKDIPMVCVSHKVL